MIGVFDSGYGGLTILRGLVERLPQYSYIYFGDNARAPYGSRPKEDVIQFTIEGLDFLFSHGAELVILACNTASAVALRHIQQEVLPTRWPGKKVLGVVVPTIEQITGVPWDGGNSAGANSEAKTVAVLATEQTVKSGAFETETHKRNPAISVVQQSCPELVDLIENNATPDVMRAAVVVCVSALQEKVSLVNVDAVLLGCTHYPLISDVIRAALPASIHVYEQPDIVAESLERYLKHHTDIAQRIQQASERVFFTSGEPTIISEQASRFFGSPITFKKAA